MSAKISVGVLCRLFGKTRHAFYDKAWYQSRRLKDEEVILELVHAVRRELPLLGIKKLYWLLKTPMRTHGITVGRDGLHLLLQEHNLMVKRKKKRVITTNSKHWMKKYPNLIRELKLVEAEQLWVSDITYISVGDDFNYLSLVTDAYSRKIMGYHLHQRLDNEGCLKALEMALTQRTQSGLLIHHSDRGVQYCSRDYVALLQKAGIAISMTEKGDPYENAIAERVNGILKSEFALGRLFTSTDEAKGAVAKSVCLYNDVRPHLSCDYLTPKAAHSQKGEMKRRWKNYYAAKTTFVK